MEDTEELKSVVRMYPRRTVETIFWLVTLSISIFLNLSPKVFKGPNFFLMIIFVITFLVLILSRILFFKHYAGKKLVVTVLFSIIILTSLLLLSSKIMTLAIFYYLPVLIAITMAYLLIIDPSPHVIILIGLCIFFLGEAFFSINISTGGRFTYPITFLRIFSLTIVTMFIYYLNRREAFVREQLGLLTQKLKDVDRRKSEFMANVSHELRTPLTSIKNAAVLLTKKVVSHQDGINISEGELTDIIISNVDRQYKLLDDLFNLARSEKGEIYKPRTLIDIGKLVERVVRSISIEADKKNIEIISNIQQDLPNIYVIADQLTEVYINLLDNAVKYNKENGKIILKIRLVDNKIESTIEDTGVGIPPKSLGRLFGRGSRFRNNNNHNVKGMGLGLSITKEIIESHSGNIWMESKLNVGTKFTFTLPRGLREVNGTGKSHK